MLDETSMNKTQKTLLLGMINAVLWVLDAANSTTMDRILSGEPFDYNKDPQPALDRLDKGLDQIRKHKQN